MLFFVDIVERYLVVSLVQQSLVQAVSLSHETPEVISFDRPFEERLGCPNQNLCRGYLRVGGERQPSYPKRPGGETLAVPVERCNLLAAA